MRTIHADRDWQMLLSYLPDDYEQLAREHRLMNPQWTNAKVTSAQELLRFILLHVGADLPLRQTVVTVAQAGGPKVSQVWLHQKMRRARPYLAALVARLMADTAAIASPEQWAGYEMVCLDGSTVSGPGAEGSDARIHGVLRLHDLAVRDVLVTGAVDGETLRRFSWMPEQLVIVDRGYSNAPGIAWVVDQGAAVLVRVNRGALPLYDEEQHVDVLEWCRDLPGHRATERTAHVVHGTGRNARRVDGRLIGFRLPDREAQAARERVRREEGPGVAEEHLEAAGYVVLFTTAPASRLTAARAVEAYRLRWQIELQFKRWKSICHFDRLPNYRDDTIQSWLTAKVLLGLLLDRIGSATLASSHQATTRPMARQPWKLTAIVWPMIVSALMPLRLAEAAPRLPAMVDQLDALDAKPALRQVPAFRDRFYPHWEESCAL
jgi:hypothetical protein